MKLQFFNFEATAPEPHSDSSAIHKAPPCWAEEVLTKLQFSIATPNTAPN